MTTTRELQTDLEIQQDVLDELEWTPEVNSAEIGVSIHDGGITLRGEVGTLPERLAAVHAALRVKGVSAIADEITIRDTAAGSHTDTEIAAAVQHIINWTNGLSSVKAQVVDHAVILTGDVEWDFQRQSARRAVEQLVGVRRVNNRIELTERPSAVDMEERIRTALVRHATIDASAITVSVDRGEVTLHGHVESWIEKNQAAQAAWASPHITRLVNHIDVRPL
jgi:osmotically-inducible protein OsmY